MATGFRRETISCTYAPTRSRPELRLVTCGGSFNEQTQHYRSNIIVYAKMTAVLPA